MGYIRNRLAAAKVKQAQQGVKGPPPLPSRIAGKSKSPATIVVESNNVKRAKVETVVQKTVQKQPQKILRPPPKITPPPPTAAKRHSSAARPSTTRIVVADDKEMPSSGDYGDIDVSRSAAQTSRSLRAVFSGSPGVGRITKRKNPIKSSTASVKQPSLSELLKK